MISTLNPSRRKSRTALHLCCQIRSNKTATSNDINVHASKCWNAISIAALWKTLALESRATPIRFQCKVDSILCTFSSSNAANMINFQGKLFSSSVRFGFFLNVGTGKKYLVLKQNFQITNNFKKRSET